VEFENSEKNDEGREIKESFNSQSENNPFPFSRSNENVVSNIEERIEEISDDKRGVMTSNSSDRAQNDLIDERKKKVSGFLKRKKNWLTYLALAFIVWIGVFVRTRNLSGLRDVTTGTWTLGPDLDPFLFLRWAKEIVATGGVSAVDTLRYVPLGYDTAGEAKLLSYLIAWFHNALSVFGLTESVTHSAVWFPVFFFALTAVAFFLFARKIFYKESRVVANVTALIATLVFVLVPSLLPRTIAGIPEKESAAFFFIFIAFYFFLEAFTTEKPKRGYLFGALAGISTGMLALIWGGVTFVFLTIAAAVLFAFVLGKVDERKFYIFFVWMIVSFSVMMPFSTRYTFRSLATSTSTGMTLGVFSILLVDYILFKKKFFGLGKKMKNIFSRPNKSNLVPEEIVTLIVTAIVLIILTSALFGFSFIPNKVTGIIERTVHPIDVNRFGLTVAENKQPYFITDWKNNFGPVFSGIPLFFWMFFIGSVLLFNNLIEGMSKRERLILTFSYLIFLLALIFSRYSPGHVLDGETALSIAVYLGGFIFFIVMFGYYYLKRHRRDEFSVFKEFNFAYILYFVILTMTIVGARGAIRLIMVLGAISPVAIAFLAVGASLKYVKEKNKSKNSKGPDSGGGDELTRFFYGVIALLIIAALLFTVFVYYQGDKSSGAGFVPGAYQMQWQNAMSWVRDSTPSDAVFGHWWDYGYWIQSIGERATILDGGNAIIYWNHLLGRHVLTGPDERKALEFLYAHDGTHLLIDSTDIGKYTAFSSIGADENYDRFSWITTFFMDETRTARQGDSGDLAYFYSGGTAVDGDILYNKDGREIFLPERAAGVGALIVKTTNEGVIQQPEAIFIYEGKQENIPLRFAYFDDKLYDFGSGLDAGVFIFPRVDSLQGSGNQPDINLIGAALYLSPRTVHSQLARLYLFDEQTPYFQIAHVESSAFVNELNNFGLGLGEFVYYSGLQGPIKIWEINYPNDIEIKDEFLETDYPNQDLYLAQPGRYG
jgi:asparagine N-glycosylation enzyme membrane subunit Stt3